MILEIDEFDFVMWKKDPVTLAVFKYLGSITEQVKEIMISTDIISSPTGHLSMNRYRGYLSAIEEILALETLTREEEEDASE